MISWRIAADSNGVICDRSQFVANHSAVTEGGLVDKLFDIFIRGGEVNNLVLTVLFPDPQH